MSRAAQTVCLLVAWAGALAVIAAIVTLGWPSDDAARVAASVGLATAVLLAWDAVDRIAARRRRARGQDDRYGDQGA